MTAAIAARDHFYMKEGLDDLEKFVVRKNIIDKQKAVATSELIYREDMKMWWSGFGRIRNVWWDTIALFTLLVESDNFTMEYNYLANLDS